MTLKGFAAPAATNSATNARNFTFEGDSYTIAVNLANGAPIGVTYFGGKNPTFLSPAKMAKICKPEFVAAVEHAAGLVAAAVKAGKLVKGTTPKGRVDWMPKS